MRNKSIERTMKLRRLGLVQPFEALKVLVKKIVVALNLTKAAYELYGKLKKNGK